MLKMSYGERLCSKCITGNGYAQNVLRGTVMFKIYLLKLFISNPCIKAITKQVERKIQEALPSKFALAIDGWSSHSTHFLGVFAVYTSDTETGFATALLAFSPMLNEETYAAREHQDFLEWVLSVYGQSFENVAAIIADNTETNKCLASLCDKPLLGCASHRFNLAVTEFLVPYDDVIRKVNTLMGKLKNLKLAGKLRKHTNLHPVQKNDTRWSSIPAMVRRYLQLHQFLSMPEFFNDKGLVDFLPSAREFTLIEELSTHFGILDSVTKMLQANGTDMADTRLLFDKTLEKYPTMTRYLSTNADIILSRNFESAIVKIQDQKEALLSAEEKFSVTALKKDDRDNTVEEATEESRDFAGFVLKKKKMERTETVFRSTYIDTRFLLPTSNILERFFSLAKYGYSNYRQALLPVNLEMQMFLKVNKNMWDEELVSKYCT